MCSVILETLLALDEKKLCVKEGLLYEINFFQLCENIILCYASKG